MGSLLNEIRDQIAGDLESEAAVRGHASPPLGYGSDISGSFDLDPHMAELPGSSARVLAEALVRRLDCPRGQLPDDPDYGLGIRQKLNRGVTETELAETAGQIRLELTKDDRIDSLTVAVKPSDGGRTLRIEIAVTPVDHAIGNFSLTLSADSASVLIEAIMAGK